MTRRRTSLVTLAVLGLCAWGGLLAFTRFIAPTTLPAFVAFFAILIVALTGTLTPVAYFVGSRLIPSSRYRSTVRYALRQGLLLSLAVVLNLILRALHSWNPLMGVSIFGAAIVVEIMALARK
jgi:hypothetical protein